MNHKSLFFIIGWILKFEAVFLLLPALTGILYHEYREAFIYVCNCILCFLLGCVCSRLGEPITYIPKKALPQFP